MSELTFIHLGGPLVAPFALCMVLSDPVIKQIHSPLSFLLSIATSRGHHIAGDYQREFERFIANFLCLQADVFHGELVDLKTFLYGAELSEPACRIDDTRQLLHEKYDTPQSFSPTSDNLS